MRMRIKGFTLIELLVVIAIIGILAAMLFPVFARARESARKIQCLSNVKNIALAIQMYLTDYDMLFPHEHEQQVFQYFNGNPGGSGAGFYNGGDFCDRGYMANPYLRKAVILDEYIKNRDVWTCPSARLAPVVGFILHVDPGKHWLRAFQDTEGQWPQGPIAGPCYYPFPTGWGGTITDTIAQQQLASEKTGGLSMTISTVMSNTETKMSQISDPSWWVVCGDNMVMAESRYSIEMVFDLCKTPGWCSADWTNCSWSQPCGLDWNLNPDFLTNSTKNEKYTRHLGGSNLGFADGHAKWMKAGEILAQAPYCGPSTNWSPTNTDGKLQGLCASPGFEDTKLPAMY